MIYWLKTDKKPFKFKVLTLKIVLCIVNIWKISYQDHVISPQQIKSCVLEMHNFG